MSLDVYGILYPNRVAVRKTTSVQGLGCDNGKGIFFGVVDAVNYANVTTTVGNSVVFDASKAILITQSTNSWFIVNESDLIFKEKEQADPDL